MSVPTSLLNASNKKKDTIYQHIAASLMISGYDRLGVYVSELFIALRQNETGDLVAQAALWAHERIHRGDLRQKAGPGSFAGVDVDFLIVIRRWLEPRASAASPWW